MSSWIRQNYFTHGVDASVNRLVNVYLQTSYTYLSMGCYFTPEKEAPEPVGLFFRQLSHEKRDDAWKLMNIQIDRGGHLAFYNIQKPSQDEWGTALEGMEVALAVEKNLNRALLELHALASANKDPHLCCLLSPFLDEEVKLIQKMGDWLTILRRLGELSGGAGHVSL